MPPKRSYCGHVKAKWNSHDSCLSCTGCTQDSRSLFCKEWSDGTWPKATNIRTFKGRKCENRESCSRGSLMSCQSRGSLACSDFSPRVLDHLAQAIVRSLPGDVTGLGTGHQSLTGPVTGHSKTGPDTGHSLPIRALGTGH
ncbi:hypothetical protein DPMN_010888 [Dreissena polymorpha]|uniref:Uncharacterized protein n=1 Tax=Dreissena polymorpha TaxID=45954 RepID=A0A9D4S1C3_DREPO|nr:hypothetical protein DPMN_010888 [Dreissena polymorpha]